MEATELTPCSHRGRIAADWCFCRHRQVTGTQKHATRVPLDKCEGCPLAELLPDKPPRAKRETPPPCVHLGAVIHREPCKCGASNFVDIHACPLHKRCVTLKSKLAKISDKDARKRLACCQTCGDHQVKSNT